MRGKPQISQQELVPEESRCVVYIYFLLNVPVVGFVVSFIGFFVLAVVAIIKKNKLTLFCR